MQRTIHHDQTPQLSQEQASCPLLTVAECDVGILRIHTVQRPLIPDFALGSQADVAPYV